MTASERRNAILDVLNTRRRETRSNLAFEFGVSKRTIEYDVARLSPEYPLYTMQGKEGGIYVVENFCLNKSYLTREQTDLLERLLGLLTGEDRKNMQAIINAYGLPKEGGNHGRKNA